MNKSQFASLVDTLGSAGSHTAAKAPQLVTAIDKMTFRSIGKAEEALVNAYGVDACMIHIKAASLVIPPTKFDFFTIGTMKYTVQAVTPKLELGTGIVIGYVCFCKGNG